MPSHFTACLRPFAFHSGLLLGAAALAATRPLRAENAVAYKYEDYRESAGRIAIETQGAQFDQDLGQDLHLQLGGLIDTITGATPTGEPAPAGSDQVPLSTMHDRRKAWNAALSRPFARVNVALGYAHSRESDYVSDGLSLNTLTDFNQKNTTLLLGAAGSDDDVKIFAPAGWTKKHSYDFIAGVTQLVDPLTSVSFNATWGRATGYLADPYKLVQRSTEVFPGLFLDLTYAENRPRTRSKGIVFTSVNRSFPALHGAVEADYRYYRDTFGVGSHTLELAWFQHLGTHFILRPGVRFYRQGAADFYHYDLNATAIVPPSDRPPDGSDPSYSSDYRLSELDTRTYGVKAIWEVRDGLRLDVAYERYEMRGRDGVTPRSAYPQADIVTAGLHVSW